MHLKFHILKNKTEPRQCMIPFQVRENKLNITANIFVLSQIPESDINAFMQTTVIAFSLTACVCHTTEIKSEPLHRWIIHWSELNYPQKSWNLPPPITFSTAPPSLLLGHRTQRYRKHGALPPHTLCAFTTQYLGSVVNSRTRYNCAGKIKT
jgi:hypothetical protein